MEAGKSQEDLQGWVLSILPAVLYLIFQMEP